MKVKLGRWYKDWQFNEYAMPLSIDEPKDRMTYISAIKGQTGVGRPEQVNYVLTDSYAEWFGDYIPVVHYQRPKLMPKSFSIKQPPTTMHKAIKAIFKRHS
jgi:hypothetical protein